MTLVEDVRRLAEDIRQLRTLAETNRDEIRELRALAETNAAENARNSAAIRGLRKSAYYLAGLIITSSIGFAFSVLTVFAPS